MTRAEELRNFVNHWHKEAGLGVPRGVPDGWLRQADAMLRGASPWNAVITREDLALVARWMRQELRRSQNGERNSVAFNAASFRWSKMMGEYGASDEAVRFLEFLALAEAAMPKKPAAAGTAGVSAAARVPGAGESKPASSEEWERAKAAAARMKADFEREMTGGPRNV